MGKGTNKSRKAKEQSMENGMELISAKDLARKAGVTQSAVSLFLRRKAERGTILYRRGPEGAPRTGRWVDVNDPVIQDYIRGPVTA
jgi:DNA-binding MarR family transcriptional regulator